MSERVNQDFIHGGFMMRWSRSHFLNRERTAAADTVIVAKLVCLKSRGLSEFSVLFGEPA
jgi:hypothetical protein